MFQTAFHNIVIILNDPRIMFLVEKYLSHSFLLHLQARFLQSNNTYARTQIK